MGEILGAGTPPNDFDAVIGDAFKSPIAELYTNIALHLVKSKHGFDIFLQREDVHLEDRRPGLPSWVPDWTCRHTYDEEQTSHKHVDLMYAIVRVTRCPPTLACIECRRGVIRKVFESLPPKFDSEQCLVEYRNNKLGLPRVHSHRLSAMGEVYCKLSKKLVEWLGPGYQDTQKWFEPPGIEDFATT